MFLSPFLLLPSPLSSWEKSFKDLWHEQRMVMKEEDHSGLLPAHCVAQQGTEISTQAREAQSDSTVNVPKSQGVQPERQWKPNLATSPLRPVLCRYG